MRFPFWLLIMMLLSTSVQGQTESPYTWHRYETETFVVTYPLEHYSVRTVCLCEYASDAADFILAEPGILDLLPNDSLNFAQPAAVTYRIRIASYENIWGYTGTDLPELFGTLLLIQYDRSLMPDPEGIRIGISTPPAYQITDLPVGLQEVEAHILVLSPDNRFLYELLIEPYQSVGDPEIHRLLLNTLVAGFEPTRRSD